MCCRRRHNGFPGRRLTSAFTLVELLVVLAVIAIIAGVSLPALTGLQGSYNLDSVGHGVSAQLSAARQNALASGHPVQVRFYQMTDYGGTGTVYRAMQCFLQGDTTSTSTTSLTTGLTTSKFSAKLTPITKPYFFPAPIVLLTTQAGGNDASSLLNASNAGVLTSTGDSSNPLPPPYGACAFTYFLFRSNGQVDQTSGGATTWTSGTLTIASEKAPNIGSTGLPVNYVTLQINAVTGNVRVFRP